MRTRTVDRSGRWIRMRIRCRTVNRSHRWCSSWLHRWRRNRIHRGLWSRLLLRTRRRIFARLWSRRPCVLGGHGRVVVARECRLDLGHAGRRPTLAPDVGAEGLALESLVQIIQQSSRACKVGLGQINMNFEADSYRHTGATITTTPGATRTALQQMSTRYCTIQAVLG